MTTKPDPTELLLLRDAARILGVQRRSVRQAIIRGRLDATTEETPRGPVYRVTRGDLDRYAADRAYNSMPLPEGYVSSLDSEISSPEGIDR